MSGFLVEAFDKSGAAKISICAPGGGRAVAEVSRGRDEVVQVELDGQNRIVWSQSPGAMEYTVVPPETRWVWVIRASEGKLTSFRCYTQKPPEVRSIACSNSHQLQKAYGTSGVMRHMHSAKKCASCQQEIRKGGLRFSCQKCDYHLCCSCAEATSCNPASIGSVRRSVDPVATAAPQAGPAVSGARWVRIKRGEPIPHDAVVAGTTKADGTVWVGRFTGEAGKINADGGKMCNFWGNDAGKQGDAGILCCEEGLYEWVDIQRGQPLPANVVEAGQTPRDGVTYVARYYGEAGKINTDSGKMWNFWGHQSGGRTEAEILVTVGEASRVTVRAEDAGVMAGRFEPPPRDRDCSFSIDAEQASSKSSDEKKADALRRLKRLLIHGDAPGVERMLPRARKLELAPDDLQKVEAALKALKAEGEFVLLRA